MLSNIGGAEKAVEVVPEYVILQDSDEVEIEEEASPSQMTIFYGGQVLVLDEVPADRAIDLMLLIAKNGTHNQSASVLVKPSKENSDLPIARRASLHKFLAKRKDRATAPYHQHSPSSAHQHNYNTSSNNFDLNL